jgi:hypothetical protein
MPELRLQTLKGVGMEKMGEFYPFLTRVEETCLMWQEFRLGGFRQMLADTISKAPMTQRAKLARIYPDECEAVRRFEQDEGFWEGILEKIKAARRGYNDGDDTTEEAEI